MEEIVSSFFLLISMVGIINASLVTVESGEVAIYGYDNCTIDAKGVNMAFSNIGKQSQSGYILPGLWFGLIKFECDDTVGIIVSKIECKTCATYCVQNQYIPGCEYKNTAIILGVVSGILALLLAVVILLLINKKVKIISYINRIITSSIVTKMYFKRDTDRMCHFKKMSKTNNVKYTLRFCMIGNEIDPKTHIKIAANRDRLEKIYNDYISDRDIPLVHILGPAPSALLEMNRDNRPKPTIIRPKPNINKRRQEFNELYSNIDEINPITIEKPVTPIKTVPPPFSSNEPTEDMGEFQLGEHSPKPIKQGGRKIPLFLTLSIIICLTNPALACDNTLFLNTQGKICDSINCHDISTYLINILDGQVICFRTIDNELVTFEIKETLTRTRYRSVYRYKQYP